MTNKSGHTTSFLTEGNSFFKSFFTRRFNIYFLSFSLLILIVVLAYYSVLPGLILTPANENFKFDSFVDDANDGNSEVSNYFRNDSVVGFDFLLKEGFINPYVGLTIAHMTEPFFSTHISNQITIDIYTEGMENLGIYLHADASKDQNSDEADLITYFHSIPLKAGRSRYVIPIRDLKIPDWFIETSNYEGNSRSRPNMNKIKVTNVTSAYPAKSGDNGTVKVYSVLYNRNNKRIYLYGCIGFIALFSVLAFLHGIRSRLSIQSESVTIAYKPVEVKLTENERKPHLSYISSNFNNADLSLEMVSKETGIQQRIITNEIHDTFGCNFKTYINQIRINESKRLLKETNLHIGEIAYKVGFNNQSHFNRVFKSVTDISPSVYRENKKP